MNLDSIFIFNYNLYLIVRVYIYDQIQFLL